MEVGEDMLRILLFADDIAMIAASAEETREMLCVLEEYCYKWRSEVNTKKSQVMACGSEEEELAQERFVFGGKELSKVEEYKYRAKADKIWGG